MFTSDPFVHLLDDPWAPHPVVNRHIMNGGGGGDDTGPSPNAPSAPDYTAYIKRMTEIGEQGQTWAKDLMTWAKSTGVDLMDVAKKIQGQFGETADKQQATSDRLQQQWEGLSKPLYEQQQREALRMGADLPAYREQVAGEEEANVAQSIDAQKAAIQRKMIAEGTTGGKPGIASQALDTQASIGRAAAVTAAGQMGRRRAGDEAAARTGEALKSEEFIPGVASDQAKLASGNRAAGADLQNKAASTAAGLYQPAINMYGTSIAPMKEWGDTMKADYDARLKGYGLDIQKYSAENKAKAEADSGGDIFSTVLPLAAGVAGSYFGGPMGGMAASKAAGAVTSGSGSLFRRGGPVGRRVPRGYAGGGAIDTGQGNFVDDSMSPSNGEQVDDVPAMVSAGEFVIPERTVDWFGEQYFQKLIMKSDKEREQQTVAAPEEMPMEERPQEQAIDMGAPMFRSEGARV